MAQKKIKTESNPSEENKSVDNKKVVKTKKVVKKATTTKPNISKTKTPVSKTVKKVKESLPTEHVEKIESDNKTDRGSILLGVGMLLMGGLLLAGKFLQVSFGQFLWPFIFIVPGALVFLSAISSDSSSGEGLSILGGILSSLGLVFLMQSVTGFWASWAYIWALIAPTSIGLSQMAYGNLKQRDTIAASGLRLTKIGLTLLAVGFLFFEVIIGISGFGLRSIGLPVFPMLLILFGGFMLVRSFLNKK